MPCCRAGVRRAGEPVHGWALRLPSGARVRAAAPTRDRVGLGTPYPPRAGAEVLEAEVATHYVRSARLGDLEAMLQRLGPAARDASAVKDALDAFQVGARPGQGSCAGTGLG